MFHLLYVRNFCNGVYRNFYNGVYWQKYFSVLYDNIFYLINMFEFCSTIIIGQSNQILALLFWNQYLFIREGSLNKKKLRSNKEAIWIELVGLFVHVVIKYSDFLTLKGTFITPTFRVGVMKVWRPYLRPQCFKTLK